MEDQSKYVIDATEMLGKGYEETRIRDQSSDRKYFTITPRIVAAYARNSHDLSLWETIKDVAGESGECFLNTEQLAILAGISTGQVSESRRYWLKLGFLQGEIRKDEGFSQSVWHLSVPDIWAKNIEFCEKYPKIADRLVFRATHKSLHSVKASPSEGKPSLSETKKNKQEEPKDRYTPDPVFVALENLRGGLNTRTPIFVDKWREHHTDEWILKAVALTKEKGAGVEYCDVILQGWEANGYPKTREQKVEARRKPSQQPEEDDFFTQLEADRKALQSEKRERVKL